MLKFEQENVEDVWDELLANYKAHWLETEEFRNKKQPFNPDKDRYIQYQKMGFYYIFTVRDEGKLVGNCGMYLMPSMHTQELIATEDTWFLLPEYRKSGNGIRLYKHVEEFLKEKGAVEITMTAKTVNKAGQIMEKLGYNLIAYQYSKHLDGADST